MKDPSGRPIGARRAETSATRPPVDAVTENVQKSHHSLMNPPDPFR
jgi:hypothetical protein